jgi:hypothetical protein
MYAYDPNNFQHVAHGHAKPGREAPFPISLYPTVVWLCGYFGDAL